MNYKEIEQLTDREADCEQRVKTETMSFRRNSFNASNQDARYITNTWKKFTTLTFSEQKNLKEIYKYYGIRFFDEEQAPPFLSSNHKKERKIPRRKKRKVILWITI